MKKNFTSIVNLFCDIFKGYIGSNRSLLVDIETQNNSLRPKSIGGIKLENYQEGEYGKAYKINKKNEKVKSAYKMNPNSNRYRVCPNDGVRFMANHRSERFCKPKCADEYHNGKKKENAEKKMQAEINAQEQKYEKSVGIDMQLIQSKEFLSIKETCLLLGISRMSLYRYIKNKTITPSKIGGRVLIKKQVINNLIK